MMGHVDAKISSKEEACIQVASHKAPKGMEKRFVDKDRILN